MGNLCHIKFWRWGGKETQPGEDKDSGGEWNIDRRQLIKRKKKKPQQYIGELPSALSQVTRRERGNNVHWSVFLWEELGRTRYANDARVLYSACRASPRQNLSHIQILAQLPGHQFCRSCGVFSHRKTGGRHKSRQRL